MTPQQTTILNICLNMAQITVSVVIVLVLLRQLKIKNDRKHIDEATLDMLRQSIRRSEKNTVEGKQIAQQTQEVAVETAKNVAVVAEQIKAANGNGGSGQ